MTLIVLFVPVALAVAFTLALGFGPLAIVPVVFAVGVAISLLAGLTRGQTPARAARRAQRPDLLGPGGPDDSDRAMNHELPPPRSFRDASEIVTREQVAKQVVSGNLPGEHRAKIDEFADAGFDRVYVPEVGSDQERLMRLYEREVPAVAVR